MLVCETVVINADIGGVSLVAAFFNSIICTKIRQMFSALNYTAVDKKGKPKKVKTNKPVKTPQKAIKKRQRKTESVSKPNVPRPSRTPKPKTPSATPHEGPMQSVNPVYQLSEEVSAEVQQRKQQRVNAMEIYRQRALNLKRQKAKKREGYEMQRQALVRHFRGLEEAYRRGTAMIEDAGGDDVAPLLTDQTDTFRGLVAKHRREADIHGDLIMNAMRLAESAAPEPARVPVFNLRHHLRAPV